mmetsp:Transcript_24747/g.49433  ORF Transcript_24747/g.49433 Transcript_24747/m.49433 type:complete len:213 (-) Transcript_24747:161-799(-)
MRVGKTQNGRIVPIAAPNKDGLSKTKGRRSWPNTMMTAVNIATIMAVSTTPSCPGLSVSATAKAGPATMKIMGVPDDQCVPCPQKEDCNRTGVTKQPTTRNPVKAPITLRCSIHRTRLMRCTAPTPSTTRETWTAATAISKILDNKKPYMKATLAATTCMQAVLATRATRRSNAARSLSNSSSPSLASSACPAVKKATKCCEIHPWGNCLPP